MANDFEALFICLIASLLKYLLMGIAPFLTGLVITVELFRSYLCSLT